MKLWRKAAGAIKDQNSIWIAGLSRRTPYRHPDLEAAIVRATSHDVAKIDYNNARRIFEWIRTSPIYLKPLAWGLSNRMEKTRSWIVALKGLMLIHGIFCCKIPAIQRLGRLPFDFSTFKDGHSSSSKTWGYNAFVRSYYAYLDQKSAVISLEVKSFKKGMKAPLLDELVKLQNWQSLLDILLQVRPLDGNMKGGLVLEAMNNLIVEVFDVYSRICNGIAQALLEIHAAPAKTGASKALEVIEKAADQVEDLREYFEMCKEMGVLNANECPKLEKIPEEDIKELEQIIKENANANNNNNNGNNKIKNNCGVEEIKKEIIRKGSSKRILKTVITEKWEIFDGEVNNCCSSTTTTTLQDSYETCSSSSSSSHFNVVPNYKHDLPDLITF